MSVSSAIPVRAGLKHRLAYRVSRLHLGMGIMLFAPAGTLAFWRGWACLALSLALQLWLVIYFYRRDPQVLERRLLIREKNTEQKVIIILLRVVLVTALILAGLDFRHGWTGTVLFPVPFWITVLAWMAMVAGQFLFLRILEANRFAASIIHVETGQTIAATGPYRYVRHPMYLAMIISGLATPLALGSLVSLGASLLIVPIFVLRLLHEEKILRRDLPGYAEYCQQTRNRLVPYVW